MNSENHSAGGTHLYCEVERFRLRIRGHRCQLVRRRARRCGSEINRNRKHDRERHADEQDCWVVAGAFVFGMNDLIWLSEIRHDVSPKRKTRNSWQLETIFVIRCRIRLNAAKKYEPVHKSKCFSGHEIANRFAKMRCPCRQRPLKKDGITTIHFYYN